MTHTPRSTLIAASILALTVAATHGQVPQGGHAGGPPGRAVRSRPVCACPLVARYRGSGSTDAAASFVCSSGF